MSFDNGNGLRKWHNSDGNHLPLKFCKEKGLMVIDFSVPQAEIREAVFHAVHDLDYQGDTIRVYAYSMLRAVKPTAPEEAFVTVYIPSDFSHPRVPAAAIDEVRQAIRPWAIRYVKVLADGTRRSGPEPNGFVTYVGSANREIMRPILEHITIDEFTRARSESASFVAEQIDEDKCRAMEKQIAGWLGRQCSNLSCEKKAPPVRCARCKHIWYCNRSCQQQHWQEHKIECRNATKNVVDVVVQ